MNSDVTSQPSMRELVRVYACQAMLCQDAVARHLNLTASDMKCLRVINCYGPMTPGELARRTGFTTGGITRILDHLEQHGGIRRRFDSPDRRTIVIEPLSPGPDVPSGPSFDFDATITAMTANYSKEESATIRDFLGSAAEVLQEMTESLQAHQKQQKGGVPLKMTTV